MKWLLPIFSPPTGTYGGLTRVLAIAKAAQAAGHEVRFCAAGGQADTLRQHGLTVHDLPPAGLFGLPQPASRFLSQCMQRLTPPARVGKSIGDIWLILVLAGYGGSGYLRRCVEGILAVVDDYRPDVLFTDLDPAAFVVAHLTGRPIAVAYQGIVQAYNPNGPGYRLMKRMLRRLQAHYDRPFPTRPEALAFGPEVLKVIPSIPELDGTDPDRPDVRYAGHMLGRIKSVDPGGFTPQPGQRYVFTYVGTGSVSLSTLERVLPQVFPAGGALTCIVASHGVRQRYRRAGVEFWPYVDAETLLPHCGWTICHGGQNTIVQSLRHGVPLLIFPGAVFERRFNAQHVQDCGAGLMGEREDLTAAWLTAALARRDAFTAQAAALGVRIDSYGGAAAAVEMIADWATERRS